MIPLSYLERYLNVHRPNLKIKISYHPEKDISPFSAVVNCYILAYHMDLFDKYCNVFFAVLLVCQSTHVTHTSDRFAALFLLFFFFFLKTTAEISF